MKGQIVKIHKNEYLVEINGKRILCSAKGKLLNQKQDLKVGDFVKTNVNEKVIEKLYPRKTSLERPNVSNIDQALIITSLKKPDFSTNLLDKLICICNINKIHPIICLTKKDLLTKQEYKEIKKTIKYYKKIGYKVLTNNNLFLIKKIFKNKTTVITGQTGAGKSTLLNKLDKNLNLKTNEISEKLGRGKHTTRYAELLNLFNGKVLDTPGFSAIDLSNYKNEEIRDSFIEFKNYNCKYKNCMHLKEKDCQVKEAVQRNKILNSRYKNYKKFIEKG